LLLSLVAVRQATHAGHHAEHVVVQRIHAHLGSAGTHHRVQGHRELEGRLVNAGEVARAGRLVLLGAQRKGVRVDTRGGRAAVVLVGLHAVEVRTLTLREAVLAVELELGHLYGVLALTAHARVEDHLREEVVHAVIELLGLAQSTTGTIDCNISAGLDHGRTGATEGLGVTGGGRRCALGQERHDDTLRREVIGVVKRLLATYSGNPALVRAVHEGIALHHPLELLHGVVKVELDLVGGRRDGLRTSVLHLLDEVLVALLGEAAALLRVEVHVVDVQGRSGQGERGRARRHTGGRLTVRAVLPRLEVHVDAHLVVLERNQGDRHTRVAAEPELERHIQRLGRAARTGHAGERRLTRRARRIQGSTARLLEEHQVVRVADQGVQRTGGASLRGELGPDLHPVTILAIDTLTTDLYLHLLDQAVTDVVHPAERIRSASKVHLGEYHLYVRLVHQVRVTIDNSRHALVEVRLTVKGHLNGLHREVGVALVKNLPERNLGIAGNVDILRTVAHELH
jgi:hypothetical protein